MSRSPRSTLMTLAAAAALLFSAAPPAWAGCGCDHPPPAWSQVMPPFGSPGRTLMLSADGFGLEVGATYQVEFKSGPTVAVVAAEPDRLYVDLPTGVDPGPVEIRVRGIGVDHVYSDTLFTALPPARQVKEHTGLFAARSYDVAVGADGTAYLALDVSQVRDAMQFTFALHQLPLYFEHDDVVIYNADGVDLTLFTLHVEDTTQYQWGSYYGWDVQNDTHLENRWYRPRSGIFELELSSLFTYWRHEFHTYSDAHAPGGSHEVDADGLHPDGSVHVDHDRLIIAIQGVERDGSAPHDLSKARPLDAGSRTANVGWLSMKTDGPIELPMLHSMLGASIPAVAEELLEVDDD